MSKISIFVLVPVAAICQAVAGAKWTADSENYAGSWIRVKESFDSHGQGWSGTVTHASYYKVNWVSQTLYDGMSTSTAQQAPWDEALTTLYDPSLESSRVHSGSYSDYWNVTDISWTLVALWEHKDAHQKFTLCEDEGPQTYGAAYRSGTKWRFVRWDIDKVLPVPTPPGGTVD